MTIKNNKIDYTQVIGNVLSKSGVPGSRKIDHVIGVVIIHQIFTTNLYLCIKM